MSEQPMDPYEARLYAVFVDYADSSGTLDNSSLSQLCDALQMDTDSASELVALTKRPGQRVPFSGFRDALLKVLGARGDDGTSASSASRCPSDDESGRELSPKIIYGSKKYGRRSKPHDVTVAGSNNQTEPETSNQEQSASVKAETINSKRKLMMVKHQPAPKVSDLPNVEQSKKSNTEMIELNHNCKIDCDEAIELCRSMRMGNIDSEIIEEVFHEAETCINQSMSVGEFFHRLNKKLITSITVESTEVASKNHNLKLLENRIELEQVIDLWQHAGIPHCRQMLHDLGVSGETINLSDLMLILDNEIKSMLQDTDKNSGTNVPSMFLQASLSLHRYELRCLREATEQVFSENFKIKTDLSEANHRAQLLAQEVDDNHAKMEMSLKNKIKQIETKHLEAMRAVLEEHSKERDKANLHQSKLQQRLLSLETEDSKLKAQCSTLESANEELERRAIQHEELSRELEQVRVQLTREVRSLQAEREELSDLGRHSEIDKLASLVSDFRLENKMLRDRNDELCSEVESLHERLNRENRRQSLGRSKPQCFVDISSEQAMSLLEECEHMKAYEADGSLSNSWDTRRDGSNATKRRGDSPSKGTYTLFDDESPRIGKVRRCQIGTDERSKMMTNSESELDSCSDGGSLPFVSACIKVDDDLQELRRRSGISPSILKKIDEVLRMSNQNESISCESCNIQKDILSTIHSRLINEITNSDKGYIDSVPRISKGSSGSVATQTEPFEEFSNKERMTKLKEENEKLNNMCRDLEASLEQMKVEYEKCEDYWASKLDEERELFSEEQKASDERFQDLLIKISEYEEQFAPSTKKGSKLPTIDEKYSLELQFSDLEEEFEAYQRQKSAEIEDKMKEIQTLQDRLKLLERERTTSDEPDSIIQNTLPIDYLWNQGTIQAPAQKSTRDYQNPAFARSGSENETTLNPIQRPSEHRSSSADGVKNGDTNTVNWCENEWPKPSEGVSGNGGMIQCSELEGQLRKNAQQSQSSTSGWSGTAERRDARAAHAVLEQYTRHLRTELRQHELWTHTLQREHQNARSENAMLRQKVYTQEVAISQLTQRLTSADLLVKELYVENCQLAACSPQLL